MQDAALELAVLPASRLHEKAALFLFVLLETRQKRKIKKIKKSFYGPWGAGRARVSRRPVNSGQ